MKNKIIKLKINPNLDLYKQWVNQTVDLINSWAIKTWDILDIIYLRKKIKFRISEFDKFIAELKTELPQSLFSLVKENSIYLPSFIWELTRDKIEYKFIIKNK